MIDFVVCGLFLILVLCVVPCSLLIWYFVLAVLRVWRWVVLLICFAALRFVLLVCWFASFCWLVVVPVFVILFICLRTLFRCVVIFFCDPFVLAFYGVWFDDWCCIA